MDYGPFGEELYGGTNLPDRKFAGLFRDGEAGLDHGEARSYQVRTERFSTVDPIYAWLFEPQRWNRYSYALNSPVTYTDATGLNAWNGFCSWTLDRAITYLTHIRRGRKIPLPVRTIRAAFAG